MFKNSTKYICLFLFTILSFLKPEASFSQCFEIESILIDACSPNNPTNEEGFNEMVRFRVGAANINVSNLNVTWPNNPWLGVVQNATTASKVAALNASITAAGNCGQILEPTGGVLPANATVILVSSYNVNTAFNSFGSLTTTIYMIFQDNAANIGGHFANYNVIPGTRTLTMSFGACTDSVTYERSLLINSLGNYGGTTADNDGATVNFTPTGTPSYANTGCIAPIPPFFTNAGNTITACKGSTINLNGIAQGHQSVLWTAPIGSFSNTSNLITNYTIPANATGTSVTLTLTGTNICNLTTNSTVTINFTVVNPPTVTSPVNYCQNASAVPLIANASVGGTLNWYGTNATGGTASSTAPTPSTTTLGTTTYYVSQTIAGCESDRTPITVTIANTGPSLGLFCDFASPNTTPTSLNFDFSNVGQTNFTYTYSIAGGPPVTGTWVSPSNYTVTGLSPGTSVTFTLTANGVSCVSSMTTTCNTACPSITAPNFAAISPICIGGTVPTLSTTSPNGISGTWSPATISNTASGTYTFTPNSILFPCASNQVLNVSVVNPITPTFNAITPICFGTAAPTLPTTSTNGITGTWSPAVSNTTTTTYTFTPNVGQCATTTTLIITVNPLVVPVFNAVPNVCFGGTINPLPTTSTNGITGTWSPALNNLASTTYTFTPINNQCATSTTLTINVTPNVTPTFNTVSPICSGQTLSPLPTTSTNGITGTWSPALNNTNTTVYTFTPNTSQCATTTTLTITVNQNVTPTFASVAPICSGQILSPLPTTSINGIIGTWSPALNNTNTTTYTFTPNSGQCATTTTLSITVNPRVTPTFNQVAPVCSGNTITPLPTTSTNGITGTWSPALNNTATTTYTFTPNSSQCANPTTMTITIITTATTPTFNINTTACSGAPINPLPLISQNGISGSWSPAINNTTTTTYTFTPNPGQCASPTITQISIIGSPIITTPSNYVVCDDNNDGESCLFDLTTKNSQISTQVGIVISYHLTPTDAQTGSNPISTTTPYCNIISPQTIYVRVSDPLAPACSSFTSFQLIVTPKPIAGSVSNYSLCDSNPSLAITEAVFNLTAVVTPQVLGTLPSASHTVTYYTSLADAQVPTNAISAVAAQAYTSPGATLWIRLQNNTTGCFDITTVNLVVNPLPIISAFYPQYELCETVAPLGVETFNLNSQLTAILLGQTGMQVTFYPSLGQAQTGTGAIVNTGAYANAIPYAQTLGIRITNTATGCYSISTMDLVVNPKPQPIAPTTPYTVCDDDADGISQFDLNTLTSGILLGAPGVYDISYHLTSVDASTPANPISLTSLFTNNQAFVQFLYVRAEDPNTGCFTVIQIELNVDPSPVMPTTLPIIANCDADSNTQDGCTTFNLTTQTPIILAAQALAPSNYMVTYYTTQANASTTPNGTLPIFNTTNYTACGTTTIWVRVQNKNTGCFQVGSFQLQVNTPIVLTTPTLLSVCDNDNLPNNNQTTFNMLGFITPSVPSGHTIAFYTSTTYTPANLISNPSAFVNTTPGSQTVFIVVTNTITGCKSYRTLTVQVLPVPTPNTNLSGLELEDCDDIGPNDGSEIFDLTTNAAYIANGDPNVTLHYYTSQANAIADTNEILTPTAASVSGNVWIRVESNVFTGTNGQNCYVLVEQPVIINPVPIIVAGLSFQECDDDTDGFTLFNLNSSQHVAQLLAGNALPLSGYTLNFYAGPGATNAIASNYTNTSNPQTIYVTATNIATGCTGPVEALIIFVNPKPLATAPPAFDTCDTDTTNDGLFNLNLSNLETAILTGQPNTDFSVTFYNTQADAQAGTNPIVDEAGYMAYTHTIWVRVENNITKCFRLVSFNATVEKLPEPTIFTSTGTNVICVDYNTQQVVRPLTLQVTNPTPGTYTYQWYEAGVAITGATSSTYDVPADPTGATRIYTVKMTSVNPPQLGCENESDPFTVLQSGQAVAIGVGYEVSNAFSDLQTITVTVTGYGTYLYSLDGGPRQTSNVFENVPLGVHTITVWDDKGGVASSCDPFQLTGVQIIDYPHYFTPNGDGINDYWNIVGLDKEINAKIYIFDRQGKLIKQISPASKGWDGTYNGNLMPSTDYWFTVDYPEAGAMKQFKAHFSLKR